jgi:recombinase-like zinc beta ribbon protein
LLSLGAWAARNYSRDPVRRELDARVLLTWVVREVRREALPPGRFLVRFDFKGPPSTNWLLSEDRGEDKVGSPYLLSGLMRCAECGSTMSGHTHGADRSHDTRRTYTCYRRRVAGGCDAPAVPQEIVEADLLAVLRTIALPPGFERAVDKAVAARMKTYGGAQMVSASALAERLKRLNEMYELGRISATEYEQKYREVEDQRTRMAARAVVRAAAAGLEDARRRMWNDDRRGEEACARGHL